MTNPPEPPPLHVLLIETDAGDISRLRTLVAAMPARVEIDWARTFEAGFARMTSSKYDAHLVASRLGGFSGLDLLRGYREAGGRAPVILLSDAPDRELDLAAMEGGAADFLVMDDLDADHLERSLRYSVEARRQEAVLRQAREELQERVEERTASLETMNAALAAEVAERRRAEHRLRDGDRRKTEFLATLAHELRNPLAPIRHATDILARLGEGEEDRARAVEAREVIERQVTHLVRLIDDLLDISRISHGKVGLKPERISLSSVIVSALEAARPLLLDRGHTLHVELPSNPVFLHGDPVRLTQILTNLLSNAARYTDPGGRVAVETSCERGFAVIRVVDSGIGISAEELAEIFTMFNQAATARSVDHMGLGIGLALAKQLTEMHGGTLTAASAGTGKGSAFTLRLPLEASLPEALPTPPPGCPVSVTPRRVLVVDDNIDAATTLAELLALDGHETHLAHDGPSAIEAAYRIRPDAAVVDIGLPGFSGLEVAQRLREDPSFAGLFLVALSGWVQPEDLARSTAAGFDHHLAKPVAVAALEKLLALAGPAPRAD